MKFCNIFCQKLIKIGTSLNLRMFKKIWRYLIGNIFSSILYKINWLLCLQTLYVVFFRTSGGTTHNISYTQPLDLLFHIGILYNMSNKYWVAVDFFFDFETLFVLSCFGNRYIISYSRQLTNCCLIIGSLYKHNDGFSVNASDMVYAIAKTPQSTPFPSCCIGFMTIFMTGSLQSNKANLLFSTFFVILPLDKLSKVWQVLFAELFPSELNTHIQCAEPCFRCMN